MLFERLLLTIILLTVGAFAYWFYSQRQLHRVTTTRNTDPLLSGLKPGIPAIVYFTTPGCIPCKTQQQPALERLQGAMGEAVQILKFDATQIPEDADRWGVMSAPTTFILNAQGEPTAVNHGVADEQKLKRQLQAAA